MKGKVYDMEVASTIMCGLKMVTLKKTGGRAMKTLRMFRFFMGVRRDRNGVTE